MSNIGALRAIKAGKCVAKTLGVILIIIAAYNSYIVYANWDRIIVDDDIFLSDIEAKIKTDGPNSITPFEKEKYAYIKRLKEINDHPPVNIMGGPTDAELWNKANLDYAAGRLGIAWEVKKLVGKAQIDREMSSSETRYQRDPKFNLDNYWDELTKDIPQQKWGAFYSAKSLAHANELRRLLLYRNNYTN